MDVVSLYNICSSLSDSLSTITGGGGGGAYYLALSDALTSSLKYVYNMTGNITSLPSYDSFTYMGDLGNFENYSVLNKSFKIHGLQNMSSITFSNGFLDFYDISAKSMNANIFTKITSGLRLQCNSFSDNTIEGITNCYLTANSVYGMSLRTVWGIFNVDAMSNCYLSSFVGTMNIHMLSANTFTFMKSPINVDHMYKNSIVHYVHPNIWVASSMFSNTIEGGGNYDIYPNIYAPMISANLFHYLGNDITIQCDTLASNTISCYTGHAATYSRNRRVDVECLASCQGNAFSNIESLNVKGKLQGNHTFFRISDLKLNAFEFTLGGNHGENVNAYSGITKLDLRGLKPTGTFYPINILTNSISYVQTALLNYSVSFKMVLSTQRISTSNINTLDFYECDAALSNSTFTIQSYYSGFDESNVWISGKPLSEWGYTLSVSA